MDAVTLPSVERRMRQTTQWPMSHLHVMTTACRLDSLQKGIPLCAPTPMPPLAYVLSLTMKAPWRGVKLTRVGRLRGTLGRAIHTSCEIREKHLQNVLKTISSVAEGCDLGMELCSPRRHLGSPTHVLPSPKDTLRGGRRQAQPGGQLIA